MLTKRSFVYYTIYLLLVLVLHSKRNVYASNFAVSQEITYSCHTQDICSVEHKVNITNKSDSLFPTKYVLNLGLKNATHVKAVTDKGDALLAEVGGVDDNENITVKFDKPLLGESSTATFYINYDTDGLTKKIGRILEIDVPKINKDEEIEKAQVILRVPKSFGDAMFTSPKEDEISTTEDTITFSYLTNQILDDGIYVAFGDFQLFNFEMAYNLTNTSQILPRDVEILFPPQIDNIQDVYITDLNVNPEALKIDKDGNYVATYHLSPQSKVSVKLVGFIKVYGREVDTRNGGEMSNIPKDLLFYTKPQKYWENSESVKKVAKSIFDPAKNVSENALQAYLYVTETLKYSSTRSRSSYLERFGADKALQNKNNAVCMEFSDLTIALLRSMGIPAREIDGYAYSQDLSKRPISVFFDNGKNLLHSWVEYYDPNFGWVEVDPTWGETSGVDYFSKTDVNRIVFVRKGNSEYPIPQESVTVTFGSENLLKDSATKLKLINSMLTKQRGLDITTLAIVCILVVPALYLIFLASKDLAKARRR